MNSEYTVCIGLLSSEPGVGVTTWRADHTRFECTWFIAKSYQRLPITQILGSPKSSRAHLATTIPIRRAPLIT